MCRDPGNIWMKFDLEATAKEKVVEEQLKDGGPVLPFDRRSESLLEVQSLLSGTSRNHSSSRARIATIPGRSLSR